MINVGIIGCGKVAQVRHIPEYFSHPNACLAGYFDLESSRAQEMADKYGGKVYASVEELLADESIHAVSVLSSNATHADITIAALKAGKHVLCEKPMAVSLEQCEQMVDAARQTGMQLMIGHNQRMAAAHVRARKLIVEGEIGTPLTFRTTFGHAGPESWAIDGQKSWFFDKRHASFGAMADLGIHKTDLIQFLLDDKIAQVSAFIGTLDKRDIDGNLIGVDDNSIAIFRTKKGTVGTMTASWTNYGSEDNSTVICGSRAVMKIYHHPRHSIVIEYKNGERALLDIDQIQTNDNQTKSGVIDSFIDKLEAGLPVEISGEDVLHAMKAVFACEQAAAEQCTVSIL